MHKITGKFLPFLSALASILKSGPMLVSSVSQNIQIITQIAIATTENTLIPEGFLTAECINFVGKYTINTKEMRFYQRKLSPVFTDEKIPSVKERLPTKLNFRR